MTGAATLRLDKWLWFARLARTRSLAARLCQSGGVSVGGSVVLKPHHLVRAGDTVAVMQGRVRRVLVIAALGERRGPAAVARLLYDEPEAPRPLAAAETAWTTLFDESAAGKD
ncbi:MAG TPA: S4 domain-containing protein [Stellaceae bacterium]|nr:S4 domain-containing protein [Stellaceae bacterium]